MGEQDNSKSWLKSKTIWLAVLQGLAGVIAAFIANNPSLNTVGLIAILKSGIDIALRLITEQPVG